MPTVRLPPGVNLKAFFGTAEIIGDKQSDIETPQQHAATEQNARIIPIPPSTNNLYINVRRREGKRSGGRIKSPEYRDWIDRAAPHLTGWKWVGDYPVAITITVLATVRATRDIANFEKAVTDLLVNQGVIVGDSLKYVTSMLIVYRPAGVAGVKVAIEKDWQPDSPATAKLR